MGGGVCSRRSAATSNLGGGSAARKPASPHGIIGGMLPTVPFELVQHPGLTLMLYEQLNHYRQVFTDGPHLAGRHAAILVRLLDTATGKEATRS